MGSVLMNARLYFERTFANCEVRELSSKEYESRNLEREVILGHLKWMCLQIMSGKVEGEEAALWLGIIQGEVRALEMFSYKQLEFQRNES